MRRKFTRGIAIVLVLSMLFTQSGFTSVIYSQNEMELTVSTGDAYEKQLSFQTSDPSVAKATLLYEGEQINEIDVSSAQSFDIQSNGTYVVNALDVNGNVLYTGTKEMDEFEDISVKEDTSSHTLEIISRIPNSSYATITEDEQFVPLTKEEGVYKGSIVSKKNGTYTVTVFDIDDKKLGTKDIEITSFERYTSAGDIELVEESDVSKIVNNPTGSFILKKDIEVTSDLLSQVDFKGTIDGNGYSIRGFKKNVFQSLQGATLQNITIIGGILANESRNTKILNSGFYVSFNNALKDASLVLKSDNTIIEGSYVLANIEAKVASGFVLTGTATIKNSYVSGYIKGKEVYGFGKTVDVENSYTVASLLGEQRVLFSEGTQKDNFYDAQVNDFSDEKATTYTSEQMLSGTLKKDAYHIEEGLYPQIKAIENMSEYAKDIAKQSVLAIISDGNLSALSNRAQVTNQEGIKWSSENASLFAQKLTLQDTQGEVIAANEDKVVMNRFSLRTPSTITEPKAGNPTTLDTTQITYPTEYGRYYKVLKASDPAPEIPANHKAAIEAGWKIVYWDGVERAVNLSWNTNYIVYTYDGVNVSNKAIKTNKQKAEGNVVVSGDYALGTTLQISLADVPTDIEGTLCIENSETLDGTWDELEEVSFTSARDVKEYVLTENLYYTYLRARFVVSDSLPYSGEFIYTTNTVLARALENSNVSVANKTPAIRGEYSVSDKLSASINITGKENDEIYEWFHEGDDNTVIATGNNYTLRASDINNRVYVKATAKENSNIKGSARSIASDPVKAIKHDAPIKAPTLVGDAEDTMFTIKMDENEGLYKFVINKKGDSTSYEYPAIARGGVNTVIMSNSDFEITASTEYELKVKRIGEYGFIDSELGNTPLSVTTSKPNVTGDIKISGNAIYGQELKVEVTSQKVDQTGIFEWRRVDSDGNKTVIASNIASYTLVKEDVNQYIEVAYKGTDAYAGEITISSDKVSKKSADEPSVNLKVKESIDAIKDTSVEIETPNFSSAGIIIGYSRTKDGVPTEYKENGSTKIFLANTTYTLSELQRNTQYFLFIRFAETETEQKSPWISTEYAKEFTTLETELEAALSFVYDNGNNPMPGQRIDAVLKDANSNQGTWSWKRIKKDATEENMNVFSLSDDKNSTYFIIPSDEEEGTKYTVSFKADSGYKGTKKTTSNAVVGFELQAYQAPSKDAIYLQGIEDTNIAASMKGVEGQYRFRYKKANVADSEFKEIEKDVYADVEVIISNLDRNTAYVVQAKRVQDSLGKESTWSDTSEPVKTKNTEIAGYISLSGNMSNKETLTAIYNSAAYAPTGNDTGGTWSWYRGTDLIVGQITNTYTLTSEDVGNIIKARYTMPSSSNFSGYVEATTNPIGKGLSARPSFTTLKATKQDATDSHMIVEATGVNYSNTQEMYYLIQNANLSAPSMPTVDELGKWTKVSSASLEIHKDASGRNFVSKSKYTLYLVSLGNDDTLASDIVVSDVTINDHKQTGTIEFSGRSHVGKEFTATLKNTNNVKGTWRWYFSKKDYTTTNPDVNNATLWTEITEGFYPTTNNEKSTLTVDDNLKGKFVRAEFIADGKEGYVGTIKSAKSEKSVTKTFAEQLEISGKGYEGEIITVNLLNSDRDLTKTGIDNENGSETFFTRLIQFQSEAGVYQTNVSDLVSVTKHSFTVRIPAGLSNRDGTYIAGIVNTPDRNIYTQENGDKLTSQWTNSSMDSRIQFNYGIKINTATDFINFMKGAGSYASRTAKYVVTNDINLSSYGAITPSEGTSMYFKGTLNGDYHTIVGLKNPIFFAISGASASNKAVIKNLIFSDTKISGGSVAILASNCDYATIENILLVNAEINASGDTGMLLGTVRTDSYAVCPGGNVTMQRIGSAHGLFNVTGDGMSVGGISSFFMGTNNIAKDIYSVNSTLKHYRCAAGGLFRETGKGANVKNNYTANTIINTFPTGENYGEAGISANVIYPMDYGNNFFDGTLYPAGINSGINIKKSTSDMIGTGLKSSFDNGSSGVWVYKDGYYPRLKWTVDRNIEAATLYAATKGAFVSLDGKTSSTDLFTGNLYGSISVPYELLKSGYSYSSSNSNVLSITSTGIITPVGNVGSKATISITYNDPDTGAKPVATFEFTVKSKMTTFSSVSISGQAKVASTYTSSFSPSTAGVAYQWYRRLEDGARQPIAGANSSSYVVSNSDAGYQIQLQINKDGYGSMVSPWSSSQQVGAPISAPSITGITDTSATITGRGGANSEYEYAYAESSTGEKNILTSQGANVELKGLSRNKQYYVFSRMATGVGYNQSNWGPSTSFTTGKTPIVGDVEMDSTYNNGSQLRMNIESTNDQKGTWKIERIDPANGNVLSEIENATTTYSHTYIFKADDVGKKIKVSYVGTGNFINSHEATTPIIKKAISTIPDKPTEASKDDASITINMPSGSTYEVAYRKATDSDLTILSGTLDSGAVYKFENLQRNIAYNFYARKVADAAYETSSWSEALTITTNKTTVEGNISVNGTLMTNQSVVFDVEDVNEQKGMWKLERIINGETTTISPSSYTVDATTRRLEYKVRPADAIGKLKATFTGTGDYQGTINVTSSVVEKATLTTDGLPSAENVSVVSRTDQTLNARATLGNSQYQFGYVKTGSADPVQLFEAIASAEKTISISGLERNTEYDLYIREAAKTGYNPSEFVNVKDAESTLKTALNGHVSYTATKDGTAVEPEIGTAKIGYTYTASYAKGSYAPVGDDLGGTWQWYLDDVAVAGATSASYTVPVLYGEPVISVRYIAKEDSDFKDYVTMKVGTLSKERHATPNLAAVQALDEDGGIGSKLEISTTNSISGVFWYVQNANKQSVPDVVTAKVAQDNEALENQWFAASNRQGITLKSNTEYIVYSAKLEDDTNTVSSIISQRPVRTVKDNLNTVGAVLVEGNVDAPWKVLQNKEIRVSCNDIATDGVWKYYVSSETGEPSDASWKIITSEVQTRLKKGTTDTYAYTSFQIPLKYLGYKVKVVYEGRGGFEGSIQYVSSAALTGTLLKGTSSVTEGNDVTVGQAIKVKYSPGENDETNGYWRWYIETTAKSGSYEMILTDNNLPYGATALTDSYTPKANDVGRKIYAEYNASDNGEFTGTAQSDTLDSIQRAEQEKPNAPNKKQINGTAIQVVLPDNYSKTLATTPNVILGYKEKDSAEDIKWLVDNKNDSWIKDNLKAKTTYQIYAKFERTSEFKESAISDALEITTGNESFERKNLNIDTTGVIASGQTLKASFTGDGYEQGFFKVVRSDGEEVATNIAGDVSEDSKRIAMSYLATSDDIGANLTVQYVAKDDAIKYGGYVEKSVKEVSKPINPLAPTTPVLTTITYDETHLEALVSTAYEYAFTTTNTSLAAEDGQWKKLTDSGSITYLFENLDKNTTYYLHARLAETADYVQGSELISAGVHPWQRGSYQITYVNTEGATNSNPTQYDELSETITLTDPVKKGYTFIGWTWNNQSTPTKDVTIEKHSEGDKSYTANWTINKYDVSFELLNGESAKVIKKEFNQKISKPEDPTYLGNTFLGWFKDSQYRSEWDFNEDSVQDTMSLYAKWEPSTFSATFNALGGSTPAPIEGKFGNTWHELPSTERRGYTFDGWFTEEIAGDKVDASTTVPANNVTYYAHWTPTEYTISYELVDGQFDVNYPHTYTIEADTILVQPTKKGCEFLGWTYDGVEVPEKDVRITKGNIGNQSYTANWKVISYDIEYLLEGGSNSPMNPKNYRVDMSDDIVLKAPRKENQVFTGWLVGDDLTKVLEYTITKGSVGKLILTATWDVADSVVSFDTDGGSDVVDMGAVQGSTILAPENPTKVGHTFDGWYQNKECTTVWDFNTNTVSTDTLTLYAKWNVNKYIVSYDSDGSIATEHKNYNETLGTLSTPTKAGYTFDGWYDGEQKVGSSTIVKNDMTLRARWTVVKYSITYALNGGVNAVDNPIEYTIESGDITLLAPKKEGQVFTGWTWDGNNVPNKTAVISARSTGNKTYTANWKAAEYVVSFVSNGGSSVENIYVSTNDTIVKPADPIRKGYTFNGWYSDEKLETVWDFDSNSVTSDTTLYAKWTIHSYTASFADGSSAQTITNKYGSELGSLPTVSKTGYTFLGWFTKESGGTQVNTQTKLLEDVTYYAHFETVTYTIQYDANGGINPSKNPISYTIESDDITIEVPSRRGYAFDGWKDENSSAKAVNYVVRKGTSGNIKLVANWTKADYKVNFESAGGSIVNAVYAIKDTSISKPLDPPRVGYTFEGWYKEQSTINAWNFKSDIVSRDITLYAKWTQQRFDIRFHTNGGNSVAMRNKAYGETLGTLPTTEKENYTLAGWYTALDGGERITNNTIVNKTATYYAHWNAKAYKITYDLDGGTNASSNPTSYTIESDTISLLTPSKDGFAFIGWTYVGQSTPIKEVNILKGSSGDVAYRANWKSSDASITFDSKGGSSVASLNAVKGEMISCPVNPTKEGFTFDGWYKEDSITTAWNFASDKVQGDSTLYAKWIKNTYTVSFDSQGGTFVSNAQRKYDDVVGTLPTSVKVGYDFDGWYNGDTKVSASTLVKKNVTYKANWVLKNYTITYTLNGGTNHNQNVEEYNIESKDIELLAPYKKDNAFLGWTYTGQTTPIKDVVILKGSTANKVYEANWKQAEVKAVFDTQGGNSINTYYGLKNESIPRPAQPTRKGYTFKGWFKEKNGTSEWNFNDTISEDTTLYAKWEANTYTICFDTNGGISNDTLEKEFVFDVALGTLPTATREGYAFVGWFDHQIAGSQVTSTSKVDGEATYYARWIEKEYSVHYNSDGGSSLPSKTKVKWNDAGLLPNAIPTKEGYEFNGWVEKNGTIITSTISYNAIAKNDNVESITLKAVWKKVVTPTPNPEPTPTPDPIAPTPKPVPPFTPTPDNPLVKPVEKPTTENKDPNKEVVEEEEIVTKPGVEREPDKKVEAKVEDGIIHLPKDSVVNKGNGKTTISIGKGSVVVNISSNVEVKDMEAFINTVLTEVQKQNISTGSNIEIRVNVKNIESKTASDKDIIQKKAKEEQLEIGNYYDVSITVKENNDHWVRIKQLDDGVELILPVKTKLQILDATFYAIRVHNGDSAVLKDKDNDKKTVTVKTEKFSTYAIAYKMNKEQGNMSIWLITGAGIVIATGILLYARKRSKKQDS